ncbi:hypothetical protein ES708_05079 [subsurface metagenome]
MKSCKIEYGDTMMEIEVPESATVISPEDLRHDPPAVDPYKATLEALENPLNMSPLKKLVSPGEKAIILCPDRVKGGAHKEAHRKVCIPLIIQELKKGRIKKQDITLMICSGLHRKNTKAELEWYLRRRYRKLFLARPINLA